MKKRPTSVSIIAWIIAIETSVSFFAAIGLAITGLHNPATAQWIQQRLASHDPILIKYLMTFAGVPIGFACGIGMLKGYNWSRVFYAGWWAIRVCTFIIFSIISSFKIKIPIGSVMFGIWVYLLFRPDANEYFCPKVEGTSQNNI